MPIIGRELLNSESPYEMGASYTVAELKSAKLDHEPGALASFTRGMASSGVNLKSLYIMSIEGDSATVGYTAD